jgi:hypothetical protein
LASIEAFFSEEYWTSREGEGKQLDQVSLSEFKKRFPIFKDVPDSEFIYRNGKWFISLKATKQLAYKHKNKEFIKFINTVEGKRNELNGN